MKLNDLKKVPGSSEANWRKGRGPGSGNGKTAGRGHKGQKARSGGGVRPGFEGGQMPLYRRLPKRGFNNARFATRYVVLNIERLMALPEGSLVSVESVKELGLVNFSKAVNGGLKLIGNAELSQKLTVKAAKVSASAKEAITKAGGTVEEV